ncbi:cytokine receptor family member B12 isoform X2 [Neoarius graeffei]|nr:cytokine receptor family member B12 isoform X2 [Neoarius graeffei]XP_060769207.1 cytokine receptor family member B12 isoform X2 [Neoarius graeffei]XP_060769208.1 cytokine receptor family member B12 isoform X2 [Neoarius graeffei]
MINRRIQKEYFVRVVAEWNEERSEWACLPRSFQPYEDTILSAPNLTVSAEQHSISISLSHPVQELAEVQMRFSVDLFQMLSNNMAEHIAVNITTRSSHFMNLPFGNYCINASAFLTARSKGNTNATMCVFLHQEHKEGKVWVVIMGVLLLLSIPAVIGLIFIYYYVKPFKNSYKPSALHIQEGTGMVWTLNFENVPTLLNPLMFTDDCEARSDENLSQGYYGRVVWHVSDDVIESSNSSGIMDEADQDVPPVWDLYSTAAKMEDTDECPTQTERHDCGLTQRSLFSGLSLPSGQNTEIEDTLDLDLGMFDENSWSFYACSEQKDSSEGETDSLCSEFIFKSNYEPRPDPCWRINLGHNVKQ